MDDQRVAIVTGANRGIGREVARQLAQRGFATVLGARDLAKAAEGAAGIVWAATLPDDGPTGGFLPRRASARVVGR